MTYMVNSIGETYENRKREDLEIPFTVLDSALMLYTVERTQVRHV